jgi:hypothetical protein
MALIVRMLVVLALAGCAASSILAQTTTDPIPAWLFPIDAPSAVAAAVVDPNQQMHLACSHMAFTTAQLTDLLYAPDGYPKTHDAMPQIVARGRAPDVYACGYCHSPSGQGPPRTRRSLACRSRIWNNKWQTSKAVRGDGYGRVLTGRRIS